MKAVEERRDRIIAAAEEVIASKGLSEATISEIARKAGVVDSVIYQYFKGKEDLLFSIPTERMKQVLRALDEQLQGIPDPESRLSKMLWYHLRFNDTHREYARILLLECRSSIDFYKTPLYDLVKRYSDVLLGIVRQGMDLGHFCPELDPKLVRDVILGTLDWETIMCLARGETEQILPDLGDVMSLIHAMIAFREKDEANKSDRILLAAEKTFAERGYTKTTIAEIARTAQVAEGTVYEYFENKEDLLLSIPTKQFSQYLENLPDTFHIKNPIRKLRRFIRYHFSLFLEKRDFLRLFLLQVQLNKRFYSTKAFETFQNYYQVVEKVIEEGKEQGVFRPDVNPRVFRNMFLGAFSHLALRWVILGHGRETDKMEEINQVTDMLTKAVTLSPPSSA